MSSLIGTVRGEIERASTRLRTMVRRGLLAAGVTAAGKAALTGSYEDDAAPEVDVWAHYGFASRPPAGGGVLCVSPDARGERAVVVATYDQAHQPGDLEDREVVIYGAKDGGAGQAMVRLKANGDVVIVPSAVGKVYIGNDNEVFLGDDSATEKVILGTTFIQALKTFCLSCSLAMIEPSLGPAAATLNNSLSTVLSSKVKVK